MSTIHPTACIHPRAELAPDVRVGPFAVIEEDVSVGAGSSVDAHAVLKRYTRVGRATRIFEHAVIGGEPQDFKFKGCESYVVIGDQNQVREGVTIHRGSTPQAATRIGDRCFLMANCHVAHDCVLGNDVVIANGTLMGGFVAIADRAFISGAVTLHQFCRVGRLAMVGASARVNQDCLPFVVTDGVPARARGLNLVGLKRAAVEAVDIA
ncbi:MAG TPA: acyl-ACP--UDP-N-acetylglucosamine O-acyltransferase, partial [Burkholderiales bacterium]